MLVSLLFLPAPGRSSWRRSWRSASSTSSSPGRRAASSTLPRRLGIMADDVMAGVYANLAVQILVWAAPGAADMSEAAGGPPLHWAEIIAVGSELLVPPRARHQLALHHRAAERLGIEVRAKAIVGDRREDLEAVLRAALARTELVVLCGGLGPTDDDLTRDAVAAVTRPRAARGAAMLRRHPRSASRRAARACRRSTAGRPWCPTAPRSCPTRMGTAPGLWLEHGGRVLLLLPGPPRELKPMLERVVAERLAPMRRRRPRLQRRVLRICGRTESEVDEMARAGLLAVARRSRCPIVTTVLTAPAQVELHLSARDASAAEARDAAATPRWRRLAGLLRRRRLQHGRPRRSRRSSAQLLRERGWRIGVAESCTGGLDLVAPDRRRRQLRLRRVQRRLLQQRREDRRARRARRRSSPRTAR